MPTYGKQVGSGSGASTPIADQTISGNNSGSAAAPVGLPPAQVLTMLGITPYGYTLAQALINAQALCGATLNVVTANVEFLRNGEFVTNLTGTGTGAVTTTLAGGVVQVKTNATGSSQAIVSVDGTVSPIQQLLNLKTSRWYAYWRVKMPAGADGASQIDCQLLNIGGASLLGIGQAGGLSSANWRVRLVDGAGSTITNAAVTAAVDANWHDVEAYNDGTNIGVRIDAVSQYTTLASALASGDPMYGRLLSNNGATATNREIDCDRMIIITAGN